MVGIGEVKIQKGRQKVSADGWGTYTCTVRRTNHLAARMIWRKVFGWTSVVVWCGVNQMIIHFFKASILPGSRYSINPFLEIIMVQNRKCGKEFNKFPSPSTASSSDDLCLLFCLYPYSMMVGIGEVKMSSFLVDWSPPGPAPDPPAPSIQYNIY